MGLSGVLPANVTLEGREEGEGSGVSCASEAVSVGLTTEKGDVSGGDVEDSGKLEDWRTLEAGMGDAEGNGKEGEEALSGAKGEGGVPTDGGTRTLSLGRLRNEFAAAPLFGTSSRSAGGPSSASDRNEDGRLSRTNDLTFDQRWLLMSQVLDLGSVSGLSSNSNRLKQASSRSA